MEEVLNFVESLGFPMVLSFYLLHRVESRLEAIYHALIDLKL